ncbi:hypothetical protein V500_03426 [Pseudogymnoascus sp. VKM F-4518 (FW-2643)]|nr:hypothetical protein V500_03426 [Pseudogymnoascus sp. VKM F-4518 (FW-2643)]
MPPTHHRLGGITPKAPIIHPFPSLQPKHAPNSAILVSPRHKLSNMLMQLAAIDTTVPASRDRAEHLPRALELVGPATALVQGHAHAVLGAVGGVEMARGEAETGAVDWVEGGEDEEVEFGGEGEEGGCWGGGDGRGEGSGQAVEEEWRGC